MNGVYKPIFRGNFKRWNWVSAYHYKVKIEEITKNLKQVCRHEIWTRDLPNARLVRYHGAISLSNYYVSRTVKNVFNTKTCILFWVLIWGKPEALIV